LIDQQDSKLATTV